MTVPPGYPTPTAGYRWWGPVYPPADPAVVLPVPEPSIADIRAWCQVGPTVVTDEMLGTVRDAEIELQSAACTGLGELYPGEMPSSLAQALMRRVARQLAARGVPLGVTGADEYGPMVLPAYDTEIARLEAPWRAIPVG